MIRYYNQNSAPMFINIISYINYGGRGRHKLISILLSYFTSPKAASQYFPNIFFIKNKI